MTLNELYLKGCSLLKIKNVDDAEFDARCLLEHTLNLTTTEFFMHKGDSVNVPDEDAFLAYIRRRSEGEPLQYILGKWEFMGNEFYVGEGVLIPRPETELLVENAAEFIKSNDCPVVLDLCSGTGCIAVSLAKMFPDTRFYAVEKYDKAYAYLLKNIEVNSVKNVCAVKGDLFDRDLLNDITPRLIVSNPPYIRTDDIPTLDVTVQNEPHTALDGGSDGYVFYRFLADYWFSERLVANSAMILECGEDQGDDIALLMAQYTEKVSVINDFNNLQRIVFAEK